MGEDRKPCLYLKSCPDKFAYPRLLCQSLRGAVQREYGRIDASAHDLAIFIEACGGPDPLDPITEGSPEIVQGEFVSALGRGVKRLKIGVLQSEIDAADKDVGKACRGALNSLEEDGAELVDLSLELAAFASGIGFAVIGLETYAELADSRLAFN